MIQFYKPLSAIGWQEGWRTFQGKAYFIYSNLTSTCDAPAASSACAGHGDGSALLEIESEAEQAFVAAMAVQEGMGNVLVGKIFKRVDTTCAFIFLFLYNYLFIESSIPYVRVYWVL